MKNNTKPPNFCEAIRQKYAGFKKRSLELTVLSVIWRIIWALHQRKTKPFPCFILVMATFVSTLSMSLPTLEATKSESQEIQPDIISGHTMGIVMNSNRGLEMINSLEDIEALIIQMTPEGEYILHKSTGF